MYAYVNKTVFTYVTLSNIVFHFFFLTLGIFILICTEMPYQPFHCYIAWSYNNVPCPGNPGEWSAETVTLFYSFYFWISAW